ncbi:MAG: hypothetical protein M1831_006267 [Alyxoria varia]|nr:MAG: hypothetical protein M1831_006267 [Alyxoria varia]
MSIKDRISALNLNQVRGGPAPPKPTSKKPTLPPRRDTDHGDAVPSGQENEELNSSVDETQDDTPPPKPARPNMPPPPPSRPPTSRTQSTQSNGSNPPLPPRRASNQPPGPSRKDSTTSISSTQSNRSSVSAVSARTSGTAYGSSRSPSTDIKPGATFRVPSYDPSNLPPLPQKKSAQEEQSARPSLDSRASSNSVMSMPQQPSTEERPPLPQRRTAGQPPPPPPTPPRRNTGANSTQTQPNGTGRTSTESRPASKRSALSYAMNTSNEQPPPVPGRSQAKPESDNTAGSPPPIPLASRPKFDANKASGSISAPIQASENASGHVPGVCLICRDFSGPDTHAARFPREAVPSQDVGWLAVNLTKPFTSHTDKARALFTWLHHNIAYDTDMFFSGKLRGTTAASTIQTGKAVCDGYAGLYLEMAKHAGLECLKTSGHGMGIGSSRVPRGAPVPKFDGNHAWNAVRIDNGEWKLIDACWGAGHVDGNSQSYVKKFNPSCFTASNEEFGWKHYPKDPGHFFRADGGAMDWAEYNYGPPEEGEQPVTAYTGCWETHKLDGKKILPRAKRVPVSGRSPMETVRFQLETPCPHWDVVARMGGKLPYLFYLGVNGKDANGRDKIPLKVDVARRFWWVDVPVGVLGRPGQDVSVSAVGEVDGADGRGLGAEEWLGMLGRKAMRFWGVCCWTLV